MHLYHSQLAYGNLPQHALPWFGPPIQNAPFLVLWHSPWLLDDPLEAVFVAELSTNLTMTCAKATIISPIKAMTMVFLADAIRLESPALVI